jgi:hypothetical protein
VYCPHYCFHYGQYIHQLARGKRSKAKRTAQKYADQDDEDRAIALELLGHIKPVVTVVKRDSKSNKHKPSNKSANTEQANSAMLELTDDATNALLALPQPVQDFINKLQDDRYYALTLY